jgi:membrane-associated phospholipid phosphatase
VPTFPRRASRHARVPAHCAGPVLLAVCVCSGPAPVAAQEVSPGKSTQAPPFASSPDHRLHWRWTRLGAVDYATTAALGAGALYVEYFTEQRDDPRWTGPVAGDRSVRDWLVADSRRGRNQANVYSDWCTVFTWGMLWTENLLVPVLDDWNLDVAWHLSVINLQAAAVSGLLTRGGNRLAARERPYVRECELDPEYNDNCFRGETSSFPSGHTSTAFTAAALSCTHHLQLGLYGGGAYDVAACALISTAAPAGATLRLVADRHYATDVYTGVAVGVGSGLALPLLLHYRTPPASAGASGAAGLRWAVTPFVQGGGTGLNVYGQF